MGSAVISFWGNTTPIRICLTSLLYKAGAADQKRADTGYTAITGCASIAIARYCGYLARSSAKYPHVLRRGRLQQRGAPAHDQVGEPRPVLVVVVDDQRD